MKPVTKERISNGQYKVGDYMVERDEGQHKAWQVTCINGATFFDNEHTWVVFERFLDAFQYAKTSAMLSNLQGLYVDAG